MDLSDFIFQTLTSIKKGIHGANQDKPFFEMNTTNDIKFDVAVEASEESLNNKSGGVAIKVVEGKLSSEARSKESNASRIIFSVRVKTNIV